MMNAPLFGIRNEINIVNGKRRQEANSRAVKQERRAKFIDSLARSVMNNLLYGVSTTLSGCLHSM